METVDSELAFQEELGKIEQAGLQVHARKKLAQWFRHVESKVHIGDVDKVDADAVGRMTRTLFDEIQSVYLQTFRKVSEINESTPAAKRFAAVRAELAGRDQKLLKLRKKYFAALAAALAPAKPVIKVEGVVVRPVPFRNLTHFYVPWNGEVDLPDDDP
jgi:hypothetical protein